MVFPSTLSSLAFYASITNSNLAQCSSPKMTSPPSVNSCGIPGNNSSPSMYVPFVDVKSVTITFPSGVKSTIACAELTVATPTAKFTAEDGTRPTTLFAPVRRKT